MSKEQVSMVPVSKGICLRRVPGEVGKWLKGKGTAEEVTRVPSSRSYSRSQGTGKQQKLTLKKREHKTSLFIIRKCKVVRNTHYC